MAWLALRAQHARLPVPKDRHPFVSANTCDLACDRCDNTNGYLAARQKLGAVRQSAANAILAGPLTPNPEAKNEAKAIVPIGRSCAGMVPALP